MLAEYHYLLNDGTKTMGLFFRFNLDQVRVLRVQAWNLREWMESMEASLSPELASRLPVLLRRSIVSFTPPPSVSLV